MITNDDQSGNWLVEVFALKQRVNSFQTRTLEEAKEEAWKVFRGRQVSTNRITNKVLVCRIWKTAKPRGFRRTDCQNIIEELQQRWRKTI